MEEEIKRLLFKFPMPKKSVHDLRFSARLDVERRSYMIPSIIIEGFEKMSVRRPTVPRSNPEDTIAILSSIYSISRSSQRYAMMKSDLPLHQL